MLTINRGLLLLILVLIPAAPWFTPARGGIHMLEKLAAFYDSHGISSIGFRCPSREACSAKAPQFTEAKASFVGPRYEGRTLPRLLFLSLDSGSGRRDPHSRTVEAVRKRELARDVAALPRNRHWYRTHEMAFKLLRQFEPQAVAVGCQTILRPRQQREVLPEQAREKAG